MSTRLTIMVLATLPTPHERELIASQITLDAFSPDVLDVQLDQLLTRAAKTLSDQGFEDPRVCKLEVSVRLSSDEGGLRPALHLSHYVIDRLAAVGASVDFDPYC